MFMYVCVRGRQREKERLCVTSERERGKVTLLNVTAFIKTHYFNCNYPF